ncbi:glycosyltransferase family 9 protein [Dinghuibacter silviterrae]|uniref:Heptosyltransferase-2 n=1 Tax=Dinghuibacter silviterrae TaxID=1539049 RepID=A0A4R8DRN3_9BACT|nr:glycosyltransferase family 9 protein [Dinghuibacter silviterrae]TDX00639.1 heptosyltransferase-2 [Dinghuibacter silviterrae]
MKILVIRFSSIGDIVLTTPVVRCLQQQVGTAQVHYLTKPAYKDLVESNPHIDRCHYLEDDWDGMIERLKQERFDYVIDLHHNLRTLRVKRALKVKSWSFRKLNIQKWILTALKINVLPKVHIVDRYMETVSALGVKNDGKGLDYFIPVADRITQEDLPMSHRAGYIGLVIGAALNTKKLPLHKLKALCERIQHPIVLLGGPEDRAEGDLIAAVDPIKVYNACGKFSLHESADLVRGAKLVISHDTGLMHIAAAFRKPIISVWGNTVPAFGMAPYYGDRSMVATRPFEVPGLWCRPCSKIGYDKCPLGHFKCMERQDIDKIAEAIHERPPGT